MNKASSELSVAGRKIVPAGDSPSGRQSKGIPRSIVLVVQEALMRDSLQRALSRYGTISILGVYSGVEEAVQSVKEPCVCLIGVGSDHDSLGMILDQLLTAKSKMRCIFIFESVSARLVMYTKSPAQVGYLHQNDSLGDLLAAIESIAAGQKFVSEAMAKLISRQSSMGGRIRLSDRQTQLLKYIVRGVRSSQIAERLGISVQTVHAHRRRLYLRLGVHSAAQLYNRALKLEIMEPNES